MRFRDFATVQIAVYSCPVHDGHYCGGRKATDSEKYGPPQVVGDDVTRDAPRLDGFLTLGAAQVAVGAALPEPGLALPEPRPGLAPL